MGEDGIMLVDDEWVERWEAIEKAASDVVEDSQLSEVHDGYTMHRVSTVLLHRLRVALALPGKPCIIVPQVET